MTSLWLDEPTNQPVDTDVFEPGARRDVVVIGAGLTGLTTALLLARSGLSVLVLEARHIGATASGNTTGKLSLLHGGLLSDMRSHTSASVLRAYVEGNREGQQWLLRYLSGHNVTVQRRDAVSYASTPSGTAAVDAEFAACREAGLEVARVDDAGLPFAVFGAVRLADQAQFNPVEVLHTMARDVRSHGGQIVEHTRVTAVRTGKHNRVSTTRGEVFAAHIVVATGIPMLDRGLYFAKVKPVRSYVLAFRVPSDRLVPQEMYLSLDAPNRSMRTATVGEREMLLVGGNGHAVGRHRATKQSIVELDLWARHHFAVAERTHAWSAQDYASMNSIPFVGWMPRTMHSVSLATGFSKWGMTNAVAAALSIAADLLGGRLPWAQTLHHRVTRPRDILSGAAANAEVGGLLAAGWIAAKSHPLPTDPPREGEGLIGHVQSRPVAASTVDGVTCRLSAVCPHLGGIVTWNAAERSWDCPLHGSRFTAQGSVLEGPATRDLEMLS